MKISYRRAICVRERKSAYYRPKLTTKITSAADVYRELQEYHNLHREHFIAITLNGASRIIGTRVISIGSTTQTLVHPALVYRDAILENAVGLIVSHNHPSGQLEPSTEDKRVTKRLKEVGTLMGIELLDHVILTSSGFYSFREEDLL